MFASDKSAQIRDFARSTVEQFAGFCPPPSHHPARRQLSAKGLDRAINAVYEAVATFRRQHRLGIFRRAHLARAIQREFQSRGYQQQLTNKVLTAIVFRSLVGK